MAKRNELIETKYTDREGIPRVSLVPPGETRGERGIPVSLDLSPIYGHMGAEFQQRLYEALHAQGLVKPADYFLPDASQRFKAAMLTVIRHDFSNAQALAQQELK
jgi:hypothetical protein